MRSSAASTSAATSAAATASAAAVFSTALQRRPGAGDGLTLNHDEDDDDNGDDGDQAPRRPPLLRVASGGADECGPEVFSATMRGRRYRPRGVSGRDPVAVLMSEEEEDEEEEDYGGEELEAWGDQSTHGKAQYSGRGGEGDGGEGDVDSDEYDDEEDDDEDDEDDEWGEAGSGSEDEV